MAKTKISEFDTNPDNNTDINNINIAEGCAPSGINNAIRQLMSDLKEFQTGGGGDSMTAVGLFSDTVGEKTSGAGVTVDGVLIKDNGITASGAVAFNGGATLGDASGDALTINSSAVSIPNGLNFDSNTFVIDATNNNVGIGVTDPDAKLRVAGAANSLQARFSNVSGRGLAISTFESGGTADNGVIYNAGAAANASQAWQTNGTERMLMNTSVLSLTGLQGIKFQATQSASSDANTLDDYEEGSWTPSLSSSGTLPTVSGYANRTGSYTKVGNVVIATCYLRATLSNAGTGEAIITGLPFSNAGFLDGVAFGIQNLLNGATSYSFINGTSVIFSSGWTTNPAAYLTFTVSYRVA